jgi:hypothetical protein
MITLPQERGVDRPQVLLDLSGKLRNLDSIDGHFESTLLALGGMHGTGPTTSGGATYAPYLWLNSESIAMLSISARVRQSAPSGAPSCIRVRQRLMALSAAAKSLLR